MPDPSVTNRLLLFFCLLLLVNITLFLFDNGEGNPTSTVLRTSTAVEEDEHEARLATPSSTRLQSIEGFFDYRWVHQFLMGVDRI